MRLNQNEIEYELEKDIKEFAAFERPGRGAEARVRASKPSRSRSNPSQGSSSSSGVWKASSKEDTV